MYYNNNYYYGGYYTLPRMNFSRSYPRVVVYGQQNFNKFTDFLDKGLDKVKDAAMASAIGLGLFSTVPVFLDNITHPAPPPVQHTAMVTTPAYDINNNLYLTTKNPNGAKFTQKFIKFYGRPKYHYDGTPDRHNGRSNPYFPGLCGSSEKDCQSSAEKFRAAASKSQVQYLKDRGLLDKIEPVIRMP